MSQEPRDRDASSDEEERGPLSVPDSRLPEDLQPSEDNPLAQPADEDVPDDVLHEDVGSGGSDGGSEDATSGGGDASEASTDDASSEAGSEGATESG
jgi:hypothetical protein